MPTWIQKSSYKGNWIDERIMIIRVPAADVFTCRSKIESSFQILQRKQVCETSCPVDTELPNMHEAEVPIFSERVLCLGKQAVNMPEIKFTERWKEHVAFSKNNGGHIQFIFPMLFVPKRTGYHPVSMNGFEEVKENMDKFFLKKPTFIELF